MSAADLTSTEDRMADESDSTPKLVHRIARLLTVAAAVAGGLLAIVGAVTLLTKWYERTIGEDRALYRRLEKLTTDAQLEYFTEVLGAPRLKNPSDRWDQYVYIHSKYYVQALTNKDGKVLFFSVTTRLSNFQPKFQFTGAFTSDAREPQTFRLGQVRYGELDDGRKKPIGVAALTGAHTGYVELYYFGKPSKYQAYVFSTSEVGDQGGHLPHAIGQRTFGNGSVLRHGWLADDRRMRATIDEPGLASLLSDPDVNGARHSYRPNTFGVISGSVMLDPHLEAYDLLSYLFGPNSTHVRGLQRD
jgi:hypothetical protein